MCSDSAAALKRAVLGGREEIRELLQCHIGRNLSTAGVNQAYSDVAHASDTEGMISSRSPSPAAVGAFGARKFGAEDRPGFDERRPLS